ncbi:MAG: hypothetical protein ACREIG_00340 [Nitrospiraceae bacterium]
MGVIRQRLWSSLASGILVALVLSACGTLPPASIKCKSDSAAAHSGVVQSLQKQLKERDQHIVDLESRLEIMKVIDQDIEKRRNFSRPSAIVTPADSPSP